MLKYYIRINIMKHWVAVVWEVVGERVAESDAHTASGCRGLTAVLWALISRAHASRESRKTNPLFKGPVIRADDRQVNQNYSLDRSRRCRSSRLNVSVAPSEWVDTQQRVRPLSSTTTSRCYHWLDSGSESTFSMKEESQYTRASVGYCCCL